MDPNLEAAVADNRDNWAERVPIHAASKMYDVKGLLADPTLISDVVLNDLDVLAPHLPDRSVRGRSLCHLQCHIGTDTLSWWRLGATDVHGVDFSPEALAEARDIAAQAGAGDQITYVEADARRAAAAVGRRFDLVVTSVGTITWLPTLDEWAQSIHDLLEPGGLFMIRDDHPILDALDYEPWDITTDYMNGSTTFTYEAAETYTDSKGVAIAATTVHNWPHPLTEVVGALVNNGMTVRALGEHETIDWMAMPNLVETDRGFRLPAGSPRIPLTFSVVASRDHD